MIATARTTPILVVDDEPKTLLISRDILGLDGYEVDFAEDGIEAIEKFAPGRHEAIVTDIRMPRLSGIDFVERVRERDADVPIVVVTGNATVETATRAVAAGAFDYLFKPIDFDRLRRTLKRGIERRRLLADNARLVRELTEAEAIPTGIAVVAAGGEVRSQNPPFRRLGAAGREMLRLLAADIDAVALGTGPGFRGRELVITEPGPEGADWALRVAAVPLAGGRALVVADDATDGARLEDELVQLEKVLSLGTLAGGIVHDLANPLTAVLGMTEILRGDPAFEGRSELETIAKAAGYMKEICKGLTEFARRARKGEGIEADVNEVVEKSLAFVGFSKKLDKVEVVRRLAGALPPVRASPSELIQVVSNLVVNACDAMLAAGARPPRLELETSAGERTVRIAVRDNGPGIPEPVRARMFEPFFTTKGAGKGTGLGLFTSRRIMKRLSGRLDLATGPEGTTFTLEAPIRV